MADDNRIEQMQGMLEELIRIVANTNSMVQETNKRVEELTQHVEAFEHRLDARMEQIESGLYKLQILERRQDKATARLEAIETYMELQQEKQ